MDTKNSIEKLNNSNYFTWKLKMKLFLIKEDLWDVIKDERPTLLNDSRASVREQNRWIKRDQKALAFIGLALDDSQLVYMREKETALDCWLALQEVHEKDTMTNKISLYKRIALHRMKEKATMEDHLNQMMNLFQRLSDLGAPANDDWKIGMIFTSLPSSYSTLVTALEARDERDLTLSLVQSKLLDEYMRQKENNGDIWEDPDKVLVIKQKEEKQYCYFCKRENHKMKDCYKLKEFNQFQRFKDFQKTEFSEESRVNSIQENEEKLQKTEEVLFSIKENYRKGYKKRRSQNYFKNLL